MLDGNIRISRQKFNMLTLIVLELFGVVFIWVGLLFINEIKINPTWIRTQGEVVDIKNIT